MFISIYAFIQVPLQLVLLQTFSYELKVQNLMKQDLASTSNLENK